MINKNRINKLLIFENVFVFFIISQMNILKISNKIIDILTQIIKNLKINNMKIITSNVLIKENVNRII